MSHTQNILFSPVSLPSQNLPSYDKKSQLQDRKTAVDRHRIRVNKGKLEIGRKIYSSEEAKS